MSGTAVIGVATCACVLTIINGTTLAEARQPSGEIAYIGKYMGKPALYVANADGGVPRLIARNVVDHTTFSWSPDGRRIAFTHVPDDASEIFVVNADGSGLKQLTHTGSLDGWSENPNWSPDGKWIVFDGSGSASQWAQIFLMRADGTGERQLGPPELQALNYKAFPTWAPDGRTILFERLRGHWTLNGWGHNGRTDLYTMSADGSNPRMLATTHNERDHCACAAWSPDGTKIAYEAHAAGSKPDIYVMDADGLGRVRLTTHPSRDENPDWSPDGMQIAFYSERTGNGQIYVMNADGTEQGRVTRDPWYDQAARWRPGR